MSVEDEKRFQLNDKGWICKKVFTDKDEKVRDHDHITEKFRGAAHSDCNINLKWTKKGPILFHNLRGYDGHLIMQEIIKFNEKWMLYQMC